MVKCIRCSRQVRRLMKSTGTCRKCRDEEIRDNRDRMLEEEGDVMLDSAKALHGIQKEMKKNKEPDEAGWAQIEDFEYENEYTYDDEDVKEFDGIMT